MGINILSKLKNILKGQINLMMDGDGMPNDELKTLLKDFFRVAFFNSLLYLA